MLATLVKPPTSPEEWAIWAWAHLDAHRIVIAAILKKFNIALTEYPVFPINFDALQYFMDQNQQLHDDANAVLGTQGSNLEQTDLTKPSQLESWNYLHLQEHQNWSNSLGVS